MARPVKHGNKWRIRWLDETGKRSSEVFMTFKDADYALKKYQSEVEEIKKGVRLPSCPDKSFSMVCDEYLRLRSARKRNVQDDVSIIRAHLFPFFGQYNIKDIGSQLVDEFSYSRRALNIKTLHNILTLLISILRFAHERQWLAIVPSVKKPKIFLNGGDFSYLKTQEEIHRFLWHASAEGPGAHALYATAIYTGMRAGELACLEWRDVDFERRLISVQRSFNGPTKNGEVRYVPILDIVLPTLIAQKARASSSTVFVNDEGSRLQPSARVFQEILQRVLKNAGLRRASSEGQEKHYIVFHDLRHTFASHWMMNGGNLFKLQKILGHKVPQMTQRYAHLEPHIFTSDHSIFKDKTEDPSP